MKCKVLFLLVLMFSVNVAAQTTEFTYQGQLQSSSSPGNGNFDFEFALFDAVGGGTQIGSTLTRSSVAVANGIFAVSLDFGSGFPGAGRFLEIRVRQTGGGGFTTLLPRQSVTSSPYAIKSIQSDSASVATNAITANNATTANNALQLGGVAANQFVVTTDPRMTNARPPTAGSANYIQNRTSVQAATNFNISGDGVVGGALGIGLSNPSVKLDVLTSEGVGLRVRSASSFAAIDIDAANSDAALRFRNSGSLTWVINTFNNDFNFFRVGVGAAPLMIQGGTGNVGIDTANPATKLHVENGTDAEPGSGGYIVAGATTGANVVIDNNEIMARFNGGTDTLFLNADGGNVNLISTGTGNVGIGISSTAADKLHVDGIIRVSTLGAAGGTSLCRNASQQISTCSSSLRYKTNINRFGLGLNLINQLKPITFDWKEGGMQDLGLGAEDVAAIEPLLVTYNTKGEVEGVKYDRIGVVLVNAVKEQQVQIDVQKKEIVRQNAKIDALMRLVCASNKDADICKEK